MTFSLEHVSLNPGQTYRLLKWTNDISDVELCIPGPDGGTSQKLPGAGDYWHFHPEYELCLITSGQGKRFVGDHVSHFNSPDLVLIGPNLPHYWSELKQSSGYVIQFVLDADHPIGQLDEIRGLETLRSKAAYGLHLTGTIIDRITKITEQMSTATSLSAFAGFLECLEAIASLSMEHQKCLSTTRFSLNEHDPHMSAISRAVAHILSHLTEDIEVDDLLKITHMSKSTFSRQFKRHTGRTFVEFLNEVRVSNAKRLLVETGTPITEIAFESGYHNLSHFNLQFRRATGISPREYRKKQINQRMHQSQVTATAKVGAPRQKSRTAFDESQARDNLLTL